MLTARRLQRTIARETEVRGVGFIGGSDVALRFRPAGADTGVVFVRTDLPGRPSVRAHIDNVVPSQRRTTIRNGEATVEMVEHVMAALAGLRIDNCEVEIDAFETPGCDGSSLAFTEALRAAGSVELDRPRETLVIERPVTVREGSAVLTAHPGAGAAYVLSYQLDYGRGNPIGTQSHFLELSPESFVAELADCRTFLLEAEAKALRQAGIGTRATEADLLIFGPDGVIGNTLRHPDECVRHKILDMVGDLALLGKDIVGHVVAHRSGHQLNATLVRELVAVDAAGRAEGASGETRLPLVDSVLSLEPGVRITAVKNVGRNDPYFATAPGRSQAAVPAVLLVEALAQAAGLMLAGPVGPARGVTAVDGVRLLRAVHPGDQVRLEVTCHGHTADGVRADGVALIDGRVAAEASFTFDTADAERPAA